MKILKWIIKGVFPLLLFAVQSAIAQNIDSLQYLAQADQHFELSNKLVENGDIKSGIHQLELTLNLFEKAQDWSRYIEVCHKLASLSKDQSYNDLSLTYLEASIKTAKTSLSNGHPLLVESLRIKGEYFIELGQLESAAIQLDEAIQEGKAGESWDELAWALIVRAVVGYYGSDLIIMEEKIDEAYLIVQDKIEDAEEYYETIDQLKSILYTETGDVVKAFNASQYTLERLKNKVQFSNYDSLSLANANNTHAAILDNKGDYDQAIKYYKIALSLHQKLSKTSILDQITIGNNLSLAYKQKREWKQAEYYLNQSIQLLSAKPNSTNFKEWLQTHQLLASNFIDQAQYQKAENLLRSILPYSEKYKYFQEWTLGSYGRVLLEHDNPKLAIEVLDKSIQILESVYGPNHYKIAQFQRLKGEAWLQLQRSEKALEAFQDALYALSPKGSPQLTAFENPKTEDILVLTELLPTLYNKGRLLKQLSIKDSSFISITHKTYKQATELIDILRKQFESPEARLLLSTKAKRIYEDMIHLLYNQYSETNNVEALREAFVYFEKSKSLLLLENLQSNDMTNQFSKVDSNNPSLFDSLMTVGKSIRTELLFFETNLKKAQLDNLPSDNPKIKNPEKAIAGLYSQLNAWEANLKQAFPSYFEIQGDHIISNLDLIRSHILDYEASLISYFIGDKNAYAILINQNSEHFIHLGETEEIKEKTNRFLKNLSSHQSLSEDVKKTVTSFNESSFKLYESILKSSIELMPEDKNSIVILPDDILNSVPFEALNSELVKQTTTDFGKLPFLLYTYDFQYGYSANMLQLNSDQYSKLETNSDCLALAPSFNTNNQDEVTQKILRSNPSVDLPGTAKEIKAISKFFSGDYQSGSKATEKYFKDHAGDFGLIHLATHGFSDFENPKLGYLVFSNDPEQVDGDNFLHLYEIINLNLKSQLTVLSACETGIGKYEKGEGIFSLTRGFTIAGVPSIVMSLWKINDKSTSEIVPKFYKHLSKGVAKDKALQKAKIEFLQNADLKYKHPYYWSGLVLIGEDQALKNSNNLNEVWFFALCFLLIGMILYFSRTKLLQLLK